MQLTGKRGCDMGPELEEDISHRQKAIWMIHACHANSMNMEKAKAANQPSLEP